MASAGLDPVCLHSIHEIIWFSIRASMDEASDSSEVVTKYQIQLEMKNVDPMLTCFVLKAIDHKVLLA